MLWSPCLRYPDKTFGLSLILDFIDRCTKNALLHLPPAAQAVFAQSRRATNCATPGN